jgi:hypothetical protein
VTHRRRKLCWTSPWPSPASLLTTIGFAGLVPAPWRGFLCLGLCPPSILSSLNRQAFPFLYFLPQPLAGLDQQTAEASPNARSLFALAPQTAVLVCAAFLHLSSDSPGTQVCGGATMYKACRIAGSAHSLYGRSGRPNRRSRPVPGVSRPPSRLASNHGLPSAGRR